MLNFFIGIQDSTGSILGSGCFLSVGSSESHSSRDHSFLVVFFLSQDFHELWHSVMSICLFTEVKQQQATLVLGLVTTSVHYLCL